MKEIMDTSLVEGYIFLFEVLDMVGKECQHILLAVIGFLAQCLVGQCADTAVALQGALALQDARQKDLLQRGGRADVPLRTCKGLPQGRYSLLQGSYP